MDIEFSRVVLGPVGNFINSNDYHYQTLKDNFDVLKFTDVWNRLHFTMGILYVTQSGFLSLINMYFPIIILNI
ncbi:putative poly(A)-specific ribonuclease [Helianthus annuus]|nr:putative poly(A)-specific ribonuclease [Helianthus annuus]